VFSQTNVSIIVKDLESAARKMTALGWTGRAKRVDEILKEILEVYS